MIKNLRTVFAILFPFLSALLLWRLSMPFWNPGGILCLIPVFYFTFTRPIQYFPVLGLIICFLIDYRCDTVLFWTMSYLLIYAAAGLQNHIDLSQQKNNGLYIFAGCFALAHFILLIFNFSWFGLFEYIWLTLWAVVLYIPFTELANRIK